MSPPAPNQIFHWLLKAQLHFIATLLHVREFFLLPFGPASSNEQKDWAVWQQQPAPYLGTYTMNYLQSLCSSKDNGTAPLPFAWEPHPMDHWVGKREGEPLSDALPKDPHRSTAVRQSNWFSWSVLLEGGWNVPLICSSRVPTPLKEMLTYRCSFPSTAAPWFQLHLWNNCSSDGLQR